MTDGDQIVQEFSPRMGLTVAEEEELARRIDAALAERETQIGSLRVALDEATLWLEGFQVADGVRLKGGDKAAWEMLDVVRLKLRAVLDDTTDAARAFVERLRAETITEERAHYVRVIDALGEVLTVASGIPEPVRANALAALEAAALHAGTGWSRELAAIRALGPQGDYERLRARAKELTAALQALAGAADARLHDPNWIPLLNARRVLAAGELRGPR